MMQINAAYLPLDPLASFLIYSSRICGRLSAFSATDAAEYTCFPEEMET